MKFSTIVDKEDTFQSLMDRLSFYEKYLTKLDNGSVAQEGVMSGLGSMLVGLSEISMRLLFSLRANLFSFHKSLKRSEIREYTESHMIQVKQIEDLSFNTIMDSKIPVPSEMTARYLPAAQMVNELYAALDILQTIQNFSKIMVQVRRGVTMDTPNYGVDLIQLAQFNEMKMKKVNAAVANHNANFAGEKTGKNDRLFKEAYASMQEFRDVRTLLTSMEKNLQEADTVLGQMESANKTLNQVATTLSKTNTVQVDFMKQLVICIRNMASMVDIYGTACHAQMALEHNHVCVIGTLINNTKE